MLQDVLPKPMAGQLSCSSMLAEQAQNFFKSPYVLVTLELPMISETVGDAAFVHACLFMRLSAKLQLTERGFVSVWIFEKLQLSTFSTVD